MKWDSCDNPTQSDPSLRALRRLYRTGVENGPMDSADTAQAKAAARTLFRTRRRTMDPVARAAESAAIASAVLQRFQAAVGAAVDQATALESPVLESPVPGWATESTEHSGTQGTIAAYIGLAPEPETGALLTGLTDLGYTVVVPVCEPAYRLSWVRWLPGVPVRKSVRGPVVEPLGVRLAHRDLRGLVAILVPGLAVDRLGNRLGQGGGYYDRFLAEAQARYPGVEIAGINFEHEWVPAGSFPAEPLDVPLPGVYTPSGYKQVESGSAPV